MKTVSISGSLRENLGKKAAKALRKEEQVPCVIYGGEQQIHFSTSVKSFKDIIYTPEIAFIEITIGDKVFKTVLQAVQFHPVTDNIYHVDFIELVEGKPVVMHVPIYPLGTSKGVLNGGRMVQRTKALKVKGLPEFIPEKIEIDVSALNMGQTIQIKDLTIDNVEVLAYPNTNVVAVKASRVSTTDEEEEGEEGEEGETAEGGESEEGASEE
ncbi:MAG: 50S ribosomal protein L25/general stress protein Ctc [Bacteroidales bacterium]|nr:50S ribosomal protein L25/general stress protein Ctc [Bacteroidales bacterium]